MKTKNTISVLLIAFLFAFFIPFIGETPSAIYDDSDSRDTVAPQSADIPVTYEWNSTWGGYEFQDWGTGVAVDSADNFYIVGTTENLKHTYDICLVKFNSEGVVQWYRTWGSSATINNPQAIERGSGIALDSSGNIYITGYTEYGWKMFLLKYDSAGTLLWNLTRSGQSYAIVIDSSDNVYIAGTHLVKYNSEGVEQWSQSCPRGRGIELDSSENIYVVGATTDWDATLVKYDSSGMLLWSRTWGQSMLDYGAAITIDSLDNIYITGITTNILTNQYDIFLIKYTSSGIELWSCIWGGSETDYAVSITLDSNQDIYLAGSTYNFGAIMNDMLLVKFSRSGMYQWNLTWGGDSEQRANAIAMDSSGNVYLVGYKSYYMYTGVWGYVADFCLVKFNVPPLPPYDPVVYEWYTLWGGSNVDNAKGMVLDSSDNIYIVGSTTNFGAGAYDMCLLKYDSSGELQWYRTWGGSGYEQCYAIALDSSDNIYVVGSTSNLGAGDGDMVLVKYDSSGVQQWNRTWDVSVNDIGTGIALDLSDNIYIVGDHFLVKFDSSGVQQWNHTWSWEGKGVALDSSGCIYVVGYGFDSSWISYDIILVKYDGSGAQQWKRNWGTSYADYGWAIAVDSLDNIYVGGFTVYSDANWKSSKVLVKYTNSGERLWYKTWGDSPPWGEGIHAITLDSYDNLYVAGYITNDITKKDYYLSIFTSSGVQRLNRTWGGDSDDKCHAIALDSSDDIYLAGDTDSYGYGSHGNYRYDICLVKYKADLPPDITPPITTIELSGTTGLNEWFISDVLVTLNAADDFSGVDYTEFSYDGINWHLYSGSFVISIDGDYTIYYRSTDIAGNTEIAQSVTFKIRKIPSKIVEEVISMLINLEVPSEAQIHINKAMNKLNRSIIKFEKGKFYDAFFKIQYALEDLICAEIYGAEVQEAIDILVALVRGLADDAIEDAFEMVGEDNEFVIRALEKYDIALQKLSNEKYDKAVKYFRLAFKNAMKARMKCVPESFLDDLLDRIADIQELKEGDISSCALDCLNSAENKIFAAITKANNSAFALSFYKLGYAICFLLEAQDYGVNTTLLIDAIMSNIRDMVFLKISDAESVLVGASSGLIETAWTKYNNAQVAWDNGNYYTAIERYILALEKAEDALLPIV